MSKELDKEVKHESTATVKEIDYSVVTTGPLFIDPKYKKAGFHYQLVSNLPGQIEQHQRWGFEVVKDEDIEIGQDKPSRSSPLGGAVTIQSKCGQLLVLMAIHEDLFKKLMAYREGENKKVLASIGHLDGVDKSNQYGSVKDEQNKLFN